MHSPTRKGRGKANRDKNPSHSYDSFIYRSTFLKGVQGESCESSYNWGKMRTIASETAFQIALRNYSKEVAGRGGGQYTYNFDERGVHAIKHRIFAEKKFFFFAASLVKVIASPVTVKDFNAFVDISRCKNWAHKIFS